MSLLAPQVAAKYYKGEYVNIKDSGVNIWGLQVEMQPVLWHAEAIWESRGYELVITSARDGIHSAGSLHYYGYAVDIRASENWNYGISDIMEMAAELKKALGDGYDVIVHETHIHVEYDKVKP